MVADSADEVNSDLGWLNRLADVLGVNLSELARRTGVSPESLRSRKARLLQKLRPMLSKTTTTPDPR